MNLPDNFIPWKVLGDPVLSKIAEFEKLRETQLAARQKLMKEVGAHKCLSTRFGIEAFDFHEGKNPEGWRMRATDYLWLPPAGAAGKDLRARMRNLPLASWDDFHSMIDAGDTGIGKSDRPTGFLILTCRFERIDDTMIVFTPQGTDWEPPNCAKVTWSYYFQCKEKSESATVS